MQPPRLQWRYRSGFPPDSLFSARPRRNSDGTETKFTFLAFIITAGTEKSILFRGRNFDWIRGGCVAFCGVRRGGMHDGALPCIVLFRRAVADVGRDLLSEAPASDCSVTSVALLPRERLRRRCSNPVRELPTAYKLVCQYRLPLRGRHAPARGKPHPQGFFVENLYAAESPCPTAYCLLYKQTPPAFIEKVKLSLLQHSRVEHPRSTV